MKSAINKCFRSGSKVRLAELVRQRVNGGPDVRLEAAGAATKAERVFHRSGNSLAMKKKI
jgi:hypothetical protein